MTTRGGRALAAAVATLLVVSAVVPVLVAEPAAGAPGHTAVTGPGPVTSDRGGVTATADGRTPGGDVLVVDDDGDAKYETIGNAVENASGGDRVEVRPGVYDPVRVELDKNITVTAPDGATLDGSNVFNGFGVNTPFLIPCGSNAAPTVSGFTVRGNYPNGFTACRTTGNWTLRDTVIQCCPSNIALSTFDSKGAWTVDNVTVRGADGYIGDVDLYGDGFTVRNSRFEVATYADGSNWTITDSETANVLGDARGGRVVMRNITAAPDTDSNILFSVPSTDSSAVIRNVDVDRIRVQYVRGELLIRDVTTTGSPGLQVGTVLDGAEVEIRNSHARDSNKEDFRSAIRLNARNGTVRLLDVTVEATGADKNPISVQEGISGFNSDDPEYVLRDLGGDAGLSLQEKATVTVLSSTLPRGIDGSLSNTGTDVIVRNSTLGSPPSRSERFPATGSAVYARAADGNWTILDSVITDADWAGITVTEPNTPDGDWEVHRTVITNNDKAGINATGATQEVNARRNYWGQPDGPAPGQCVGNVDCGGALEARPPLAGDDPEDAGAVGEPPTVSPPEGPAGPTGPTLPLREEEPEFQFDGSVNDSSVFVGDTVRVEISAENAGEEAGSFDERVTADFESIGRYEGRLEPGESTSGSFTTEFDEPGEYVISVGGTVVETVEVDPLPPAVATERYLEVESAYTSKLVVENGEYETIARVRDTDDTDHEFLLNYSRDGAAADQVNVTRELEPGEAVVTKERSVEGGNGLAVERFVNTTVGNLSVGGSLGGGVTYAYVYDAGALRGEPNADDYRLVTVVRSSAEGNATTVVYSPPGEQEVPLEQLDDRGLLMFVDLDAGEATRLEREVDDPEGWRVNGVPAPVLLH